MTEQHQQLAQDLLPHLTLELEHPVESEGAPKHAVNISVSLCVERVDPSAGGTGNTHSATEARSLEMSLVFLNSLQRATRATQNG